MQPTIGRIVHYTLSEYDADAIMQRRAAGGTVSDMAAAGGTVANMVAAGQTYPAMVVRTFGGDAANLQVFLDGNDTYWATSRTEGDQPGTWAWPPRA